ncbi:MAG: hypothetical protein HUJ26_19160 [Planctomycetaceae bacterium]|nr:hypothetical protein [Planctomycetaceae bacterium]
MTIEFEKTRVLITVMTYPHPSPKYDELVCTAGISESGEWVRLYPIDYRYRPPEQKFRKYQWIDVELGPRGHKNDARKESREPRLDSIKLVGERISTEDGWRERREIIDQMPHHTLNELQNLYDQERASLGIVRPTRIFDLEITETSRDWKPKYQKIYQQMRLFGEPPKPLRKIPFEFRYVFECEDSAKAHRALITDWELGVLYLKEEKRLRSSKAAAESVKKKFFDEICGDSKDTRFFMGTTLPYNTWLVIGTFWPPKQDETTPTLF